MKLSDHIQSISEERAKILLHQAINALVGMVHIAAREDLLSKTSDDYSVPILFATEICRLAEQRRFNSEPFIELMLEDSCDYMEWAYGSGCVDMETQQ